VISAPLVPSLHPREPQPSAERHRATALAACASGVSGLHLSKERSPEHFFPPPEQLQERSLQEQARPELVQRAAWPRLLRPIAEPIQQPENSAKA
jgi:hypothetical protein